MKHLITFLSLTTLVCCTGGLSTDNSSTRNTIDESNTKEIYDHHIKVFFDGDLEGVMADYSEESIIITPEATIAGTTEIKKFFEGLMPLFPTDSTTFNVVKQVVKNDVAFVVWNCKTPKIVRDYATDTFIIQGGKIVRQTVAGH